MSHELSEFSFPLPATPSVISRPAGRGKETRFQEASLIPSHAPFPQERPTKGATQQWKKGPPALLAAVTLGCTVQAWLAFNQGPWHTQ